MTNEFNEKNFNSILESYVSQAKLNPAKSMECYKEFREYVDSIGYRTSYPTEVMSYFARSETIFRKLAEKCSLENSNNNNKRKVADVTYDNFLKIIEEVNLYKNDYDCGTLDRVYKDLMSLVMDNMRTHTFILTTELMNKIESLNPR